MSEGQKEKALAEVRSKEEGAHDNLKIAIMSLFFFCYFLFLSEKAFHFKIKHWAKKGRVWV